MTLADVTLGARARRNPREPIEYGFFVDKTMMGKPGFENVSTLVKKYTYSRSTFKDI